MKLRTPVIITSRLLPGLTVGDGTISIEYGKGVDHRGAPKFNYYIDTPTFEHSGHDISGWGGLQEGLESLLSFLGAASESYDYARRMSKELSDTENGDLFPPHVAEWAYMNNSELSQAALELEENAELIQE